jgi:amino acid transporter
MAKRFGLSFLHLLIITAFLIIPFFVFASEKSTPLSRLKNIGSGIGYNESTTPDTVFDTISLIIGFVFGLLSLIFLGLTIYSGMRWMTASGKEEEVTKAKDTLKQAIIGLLIVIGSWGIWGAVNIFWLSKL